MLEVSYFPDHRPAVGRDTTHLTGPQAQGGVIAFPRNQLRRRTGRPGNLRPLSGTHLDTMDRSSDRNIPQDDAIANGNRGITARGDLIAGLQTLRRDDVRPFAVQIPNQRNICTSIRIVLDPLDNAFYADLVAFEIYDPVALFVATSAVSDRNPTGVIPSA